MQNANTYDSSDGAFSHRSIFVLVLLIPFLTAIVFGGADVSALIFISPLVAVIALVWMASAWRSGKMPLNRDVLLLPLLGLVALACVQLLPLGSANISSADLAIPASATLSLDQYATRMFLVRLIGYLIFFMACLTFIDSERRIKATVNSVIIFGGAIAFAGILQKLASPGSIYGVREVEQAIPFGPFVNQHHFAALMVMTSGLAIARLFDKMLRRDMKLLFGLAALIMLIALLMTTSRGGVVSYLAMLGFVILFSFPSLNTGSSRLRSPAKLVGAAAAIVAAVILIAGSVGFLGGEDALLRAIGLQPNQTDVTSGRLHFWSIALRIFADNPVIGAGLDAFGVAFTRYDTWNGNFRVEQAHNDYLQMLADGGILAFGCVAAFIFLFAKKSVAAVSGSGNLKAASVGAFAGCVGVLVHSFFDFPLRTPANAFFFLLLAAVAVIKSDGFSRSNEK